MTNIIGLSNFCFINSRNNYHCILNFLYVYMQNGSAKMGHLHFYLKQEDKLESPLLWSL